MNENRENREYCARIARELDEIARGNCYKCPECGEVITFDNGQYNQGSEEYTCQECGKTFPEYELEAYTIYDWLCDALDVKYTVDSRLEFLSAEVYVTLGGPTVWVDTGDSSVNLHWGCETARHWISQEAADELESAASELYEMAKAGGR